jgi:hypothetical protein
LIAALLVEGILLRRWPLSAAPAIGAVVAVLTIALLAFEEGGAALLPSSMLPASVRRLAIDVYGGPGAWLALGASLLLVAASRVEDGALGVGDLAAAGIRRLPLQWIAATSAATLGAVAAAWCRYQPWAVATAGDRRLRVPGWALPFLGPLSLLVVTMLAVAVALAIVRRTLVAALMLAASGWALSLIGAIAITAAGTLARVPVDRVVPDRLLGSKPSVAIGWGAWLAFGLGCTAAGCGAMLVRCHEGGAAR